jgi:UDP-N-acetylmuramoyl-L-alanyl-D-glutamate--2,6-diaminopimelate ligase
MKLSELAVALPRAGLLPWQIAQLQAEVGGICSDSRRVQPGDLFVAIPGVEVDGHSFIPDALRRGAAAVVGQRPASELWAQRPPVPYVPVADSRQALAWLFAAWYGYPARKLKVIGVTGTDGKTTTVRLIAAILAAAGYRVGWISTVNAFIAGEEIDTGFHTTTPDAPDVQRYLARMVEADAQYAVIEATSHGLAQHRVAACEFDVAVVTNITHEHLDYHHTFAEYRSAKARLFQSLSWAYRKPDTPKVAVLNLDDPSYEFLEPLCPERCFAYSVRLPADVQAADVQTSPSGITFRAITPDLQFDVVSPLLGGFNVCNILAAITVAGSQGVEPQAMQQGILDERRVTGRMERIDLGQDFTVIIDFAHTPNALEKALTAARSLGRGAVIAVFGAAGLRDRTKRPMMGEVAGRLADAVLLTAEDPRTEDVSDIIDQIAAGCEKVGRHEGVDYWRIPDRAAAIAAAIDRAQPGDAVIITGKGHERSMCFGTTEQPWSEHETVHKAVLRRLGKATG